MTLNDPDPGLYCCTAPCCGHVRSGPFNGGAWNGDPPRLPNDDRRPYPPDPQPGETYCTAADQFVGHCPLNDDCICHRDTP